MVADYRNGRAVPITERERQADYRTGKAVPITERERRADYRKGKAVRNDVKLVRNDSELW